MARTHRPRDEFFDRPDQEAGPARSAFPVVPQRHRPRWSACPRDSTSAPAGTVRLRAVESPDVVAEYVNLGDGSYIAVRALFVLATGTTASDLIAEA